MEMDDETAPQCISCGVPVYKHLGLYGTCKKLQEVMDIVKVIKAKNLAGCPYHTIDRLCKEVLDYE